MTSKHIFPRKQTTYKCAYSRNLLFLLEDKKIEHIFPFSFSGDGRMSNQLIADLSISISLTVLCQIPDICLPA